MHESAWNAAAAESVGLNCSPHSRVQRAQLVKHNRCVPDIASDANPGTGVPVYDTFSYSGWVQVGGTSVATPIGASLLW